MLAHDAAAADISALPAAGAFRGRHLPPRELLARTGSHAVSPPHHPKVEHATAHLPADPNPSQHAMQLLRRPTDGRLELMEQRSYDIMYARPAGVASAFQTGKVRGIFKQQSVVGQFSTEAVSAIPQAKKEYNSVRETGMCYVPQQPHTNFVRKALTRSGAL